MKKILLIIGALLILIPLNTEALTGNVSVSCNNTKLTANATTTCTIRGNINEEVTTVHAKIELGSNLSLVGVTPDSSWEGDGEGGVLDLYTDVNKKGTFNIATFQVKAGNVTTGANTNITLSEVTLSDAEFNETTFTVTPVSIRIPSSINTLSALSVSGASLDFSSSKTTYDLTIDDTTTNISANKTDSNSTITGTGNKTLNYGKNTFVVTVTAENGSKKNYTINITRPDDRSTNNNLSSLDLSEGNIAFDKNKTNYEIVVENEIDKITIEGKVEDSKAKVEGLGTKNLIVGNNTFTIKVTAENGSVKEYKVVIIRQEEEKVTEDNNIKNLIIEGYDLEFDPEKKDYILTTEETQLDIEVELENEDSTYEIIGNEDLEDGSIIQIIVTDSEGNNNIYNITIDNPSTDIPSSDSPADNGNNNDDDKDINYIPIIMSVLLGILIIVIIVLIVKKLKKNR